MDVREKLVKILEDVDGESGFRLLGHKDVIRIADHLISNGVTVQEWISVSERLPNDPMEYIVMIKGGTNATTLLFDGDSWFEADDLEFKTYYQVTHWMPLPEPPKDG